AHSGPSRRRRRPLHRGGARVRAPRARGLHRPVVPAVPRDGARARRARGRARRPADRAGRRGPRAGGGRALRGPLHADLRPLPRRAARPAPGGRALGAPATPGARRSPL
ncbi:MAG: Thioredoxin, partial [uncultured Solirubrobacteraceae bacterium]